MTMDFLLSLTTEYALKVFLIYSRGFEYTISFGHFVATLSSISDKLHSMALIRLIEYHWSFYISILRCFIIARIIATD